jgi:deazaflavin-dependent oxidoreductase (nitroreductase family)
MAKTYRVTAARRLINRIFSLLTRHGVGASYRHIHTVPGRKTGRLYSTPVDIIEFDGQRWLIAGYGPATWTKNVRAAGEVTLTRGGASRRFATKTAKREEAIGPLRIYIQKIRVTRPYFDARPDSPDDAIAVEFDRHPVFRLVSSDNEGARPSILPSHGVDGSGSRREQR